jgi:hypothetical protein
MVSGARSQPDRDQNSVHQRRYEASLRLRGKSLLAWAVERIFRGLQHLSPASHFEISRKIDYYISIWIGIGFVLALLSYLSWPTIPRGFSYLLVPVAILRILDIVQATTNAGIFDQLGTKYQEVEELTRSLVLLLVNYLEMIGWFGLIYLTCELENASSFYDAFYFSVVTQLTVGYGDIHPVHIAKTVAGIQATLGWALTILILARFISSLPEIRSKGNGTGSSDPPRKKETSDAHPAASGSGRSILLLVSIIISLGALYFAAQTYYVAHRPYIGVVHANSQIITGDKKVPVGMKWSFMLQNTGGSPALVALKKNLPQFTTGNHIVTLPNLGPPQGLILMMPNQTANLSAAFKDDDGYAKTGEILTGMTVLTVDIELTYTPIGWFWWKNSFVYRARNRFRHNYTPPAFEMESAFAN